MANFVGNDGVECDVSGVVGVDCAISGGVVSPDFLVAFSFSYSLFFSWASSQIFERRSAPIRND